MNGDRSAPTLGAATVPRSLSPVGTQPGPGVGSFPLGASPRKLPDSCSQSQAGAIELKGGPHPNSLHPQEESGPALGKRLLISILY